jgi:hypothetical protein
MTFWWQTAENILIIFMFAPCINSIKTLFIIPTDAHNYTSMRYTIEEGLPLPCTARLHNRLVRRHNIDHVINDEHNRILIVVLAKHEIAPWWWFLREPKHVGAIIGILIVFNISMIL